MGMANGQLDTMPREDSVIWRISWVVAALFLASGAALSGLVPITCPANFPTTLPTNSAASLNAPASAQTHSGRPAFSSIHGHQGFWRIVKTPQGVWWFLSPDDRFEFLNFVDTVQPVIHGRDPAGPDFISTDFDSHAPDAMDRWARASVSRVLNIGFKGVGAWSAAALHKCEIPMTQDLNISAWASASNAMLFSPAWAKSAEDAVRTQAAPLRDNKNLVGYYLDNEIDWEDEPGSPATYFDNLHLDDPNRKEVLNVIQSTWPTIDAFNSDWKLSLHDWATLSKLPTLPRSSGVGYDRLASAWLFHLADAYFKITTDLLKKYDPNHLILGVRYRGSAPPEVARASRPYTDAQSLNYYVADARLDSELFNMLAAQSEQPLVISEYSFHALDNRSGDRNLIGFDAQVPDQQSRGQAYRLLTTRLARVPYIIGADWFEWADEPSSGRDADGEDVNFGVVDVDDHVYEPLGAAVRDTTLLLDPLHAHSAIDGENDVWRPPFERPVANVPFLAHPPRLDGKLDDWPAECRIKGMRQDTTVGGEQNRLPPPDVYLGWTNEGLYLGFTVYDNDISAAPAGGWWWARDSVEFWVATRLPASVQRDYDQYDHHFFFVPVDYPTMTGSNGVVGQWHSPGDAIKDNLVPHPDIKQVCRIHSNRYTVDMFIPAKALNGFDPVHHPTLAFNFHARDYQHALAYFWSAPKQVQTQAHPDTWGILNLLPAYPTNHPTLAAADASPAAVK